MFLYQYLEDYSSNFLDYTLVFESLKHSVILIAFWLAVLFLDCQQSPAISSPSFVLLVCKEEVTVCGFICCYWRLKLLSPSRSQDVV